MEEKLIDLLECNQILRNHIKDFIEIFVAYYGENERKYIEDRFNSAQFVGYLSEREYEKTLEKLEQIQCDKIYNEVTSKTRLGLTKIQIFGTDIDDYTYDDDRYHPITKYKLFYEECLLGEEKRIHNYYTEAYNQLGKIRNYMTFEEYMQIASTGRLPQKYDNLDEKYREELMNIAETQEGLEKLYNEAKKIDEKATEKISPNDKKRIIRILEIYKATGKNKTEQEIESRKKEIKYDYKIFAINMDREKLYERINIRVDRMLENGLIEEVEKLQKKYNHFPTAMQGLGYKEVVEYLQSQITREEMIEKIKQESRRYAKRQLTWFRKNKQTIWIDGLANLEDNINIIEKELNK